MVAIRVEGLGKRYRLAGGGQRAKYRTLRETLVGALSAPFRRRSNRPRTEDFWALKDVNFEVQPGEVVGIIGRNGAGKSTLLKVLSRITRPTAGRVEIDGRVGSLLEVGTGFHPELTGRENVYLNGSILGMSRRDIDRKFDEIVAFAEVEKFLDTPVKRYSSGMYVRLAFAVAAHLEPEILIVDEVLAVGDAEFQKKCLGKMRDVSRSGRTVLFVSHNMAALQNLSSSGVLMSGGRVEACGEINEIIGRYVSQLSESAGGDVDLRAHPTRVPGAVVLLERARLLDGRGQPCEVFPSGARVTLEFRLVTPPPLEVSQIGVGVNDHSGHRVFTVATYYASDVPSFAGTDVARCVIDSLPLAPGRYTLTFAAGHSANPTADWLQHAVAFTVVESDFFGSGRAPSASHGSVLVRSEWSAGGLVTPKREEGER